MALNISAPLINGAYPPESSEPAADRDPMADRDPTADRLQKAPADRFMEPSSSDASPERNALAEALLSELTAFRPQDGMAAFRRWHRAAFSLVHLNVVTALQAEGPLSMSQLADALDVSMASATGIVTRMEIRGLVERRHATDDRRVVEVHLTEQGAGLFGELEQRRYEHLREIIGLLTDEERAGFLTGLRAMQAARRAVAARRAADADTSAADRQPGSRHEGSANA